MKRRFLVLIVPAILSSSGCSQNGRSSLSLRIQQSSVAPAPKIDPNDKIKTLAAYTAAAQAAQKSLPESLTKTSGPQRLIIATRALATLRSEPARAYARSLIQLLKTYNLDAGPLPSTGTSTVSYSELATLDVLSQSLMCGPENEHQGPAPAGPNTIPYSLHFQMLVLISGQAPSDGAAISAAFNTTNPLPADISLDSYLSPAQRQQLYVAAWDNLRAHFTDSSRPVNLTAAGLAFSSGIFAYALYYAGNALAATPERVLTGQELQDLIRGYARITKAIKALDPTVTGREDSSPRPFNELMEFARIMDDNIAITRAARPDITRFFNALAANDNATVKTLSSNSEKQTAAQWRDYFSFDRPNPVKSLEILGLGITESAQRISVTLKKTDTSGKVDTDQQYVTVRLRKQNDHWIIIEGDNSR